MMLSEKTFLEFAAKSYCNPRCLSIEEFLEDLARIKYVKRLLNRYKRSGKIQSQLIVNHLIAIYNVFDIGSANEMLFFKCEKNTHPALRSFLLFLNYLPLEMMEDKIDKKVLSILEDL